MYTQKPKPVTQVFVRAKEKHSDTCKWTSGLLTGRTDTHREKYEVTTDSPFVEPDKQFYHKEDIKNPDNVESIEKLNRGE